MSVILYSRKTWGVCKCGHYQWQHDNSIPKGEDVNLWARGEGHGRCGCEGCGCEQYTWKETIKASRAKTRVAIDEEITRRNLKGDFTHPLH